MKTLIVCFSNYNGNTEKIARLFAEKTGGDLVNLKNIDAANDINVNEYGLIGLGSGVYKENLNPKLLSLANDLPLEGKDVFVFSTSGVGLKYYNNKLIKILKAKGVNVLGSFACKGSFNAKEFTDNKFFNLISKFSQGHPNERDMLAAERFIDYLTNKKTGL